MTGDQNLLEAIAGQVDLPPDKILRVLDHSFRELHRRMYEYDGLAYMREKLIHELSPMAWMHLYFFLAYNHITYTADDAQDVLPMCYTQLQYLGDLGRWQPYLDDIKNWKMSRHLRSLLDHELER